MSSPAQWPDGARTRFDRALDREKREQTALLDWLAQSQKAESLRQFHPDGAEPTGAVIDLRHDVVIDLRDESRPRRRRDLAVEIDDAPSRSQS